MPIAAFKDLPEIVAQLVATTKQMVSFGYCGEARRQFLSPIKYMVTEVQNIAVPHPLIKHISILGQEDPEKIIILACFPIEEVWKKVKVYGDFTVMPYFTLDYLRNFLPGLENLPLAYKRTLKKTTGKRGIVFRGQPVGVNGLQAVQKFAADYPDDYIVISTWDTIETEERKKLEEVCDKVILNHAPKMAGYGHRNFQLACIQPGIQALLDAGVEKILVARMDFLFTDPFMLDTFDVLLGAYSADEAKKYGQKGRLIIPDMVTRRYYPYHPSDMLTYGWAEDVARFWMNTPYDFSDFPPSTYNTYEDENIAYMSKNYPLAEAYFAREFLKRIGRPIEGTVEDSLKFYRDFFIVVDYLAFGMFWFKHTWLDRRALHHKTSRFVTHERWLALQSSRDLKEFVDVDINLLTGKEYHGDM